MLSLCAEGVVACWELLLKCTANRAVRGRTDFLRREVGVTHKKNCKERGEPSVCEEHPSQAFVCS